MMSVLSQGVHGIAWCGILGFRHKAYDDIDGSTDYMH